MYAKVTPAKVCPRPLHIFFLDFIQNSDAEHIRGTECDQKILSRKESKGQVGSIMSAHLEQKNCIDHVSIQLIPPWYTKK